MTKAERAERMRELENRDPRDLAGVVVQAEESCQELRKRLAKAKEMASRKFLREVADVLESVMSTDPEMASHEATMADAERMLSRLREFAA